MVCHETKVVQTTGLITYRTLLVTFFKSTVFTHFYSIERFIRFSLFFCLFFTIVYFLLSNYRQHQAEERLTQQLIASPNIHDIYFLDFRLFDETLRPKEKYRIAKIFDITGDIVTLRYGDLLFPTQQKAKQSIQFGQLSFDDYFQPERYHFSKDSLKKMKKSGMIYLVKRPVNNKLYGNVVSPISYQKKSTLYVSGKREYYKGLALSNDPYNELGHEKAFKYFERSAQLGYVKGQISLAEMYLNGHAANKNLAQALYWLSEAALQSDKRAILKYGIVCNKVPACDITHFYQFLIESGVNLKVRDFKMRLTP